VQINGVFSLTGLSDERDRLTELRMLARYRCSYYNLRNAHCSAVASLMVR
jgi:hypothetical protein